jgi:queuine/archaeosine tRNA-ribosyltransferase
MHVTLDHVELPINFCNEIFTDLTEWAGEAEDPAIQRLISRIGDVLRTSVTVMVRPESLTVNGKSLELPSFVRSISSHETLLAPKYAMLALALHPSCEPILVSTYDLLRSQEIDKTDICQRVSEIANRGVPIFVDSGNYEAFRKGERPEKPADYSKPAWTDRDFHAGLQEIAADFVFSYDDPFPQGTTADIVGGMSKQVADDRRASGGTYVIPIIHAPLRDGKRKPDVLPELVELLLKELDCSIVAIPERELGEGILARARTIRTIRKLMESQACYHTIHLLGTGNPISLAILAAAGADIFDGLEWCRTAIDHDTARLHHSQHFDFFANQCKFSEFEEVRTFTSNLKRDYHLRLLVHNLDFFHRWVTDLRFYLRSGRVMDFLDSYLPTEAIEKLESSVSEVIEG